MNRFQPLEPYKVLTYEEVIEKARKQFKNHPNHIQILERISKRLEDCHYREAVLNDKRPQIDLIESDSYKTEIVKGSFDYGREKMKSIMRQSNLSIICLKCT
ncbi:MAG: hypothetical protein HWD61_09190 [Parachlamydiaceae bacterium]|nr:MAG: hypothetical protein HWD61_09190 [Parachlamydiaceae bacterium]